MPTYLRRPQYLKMCNGFEIYSIEYKLINQETYDSLKETYSHDTNFLKSVLDNHIKNIMT